MLLLGLDVSFLTLGSSKSSVIKSYCDEPKIRVIVSNMCAMSLMWIKSMKNNYYCLRSFYTFLPIGTEFNFVCFLIFDFKINPIDFIINIIPLRIRCSIFLVLFSRCNSLFLLLTCQPPILRIYVKNIHNFLIYF